MHAFEEAIAATATRHAPWFVVPAVVQSAPRLRGYRGGNGEPGPSRSSTQREERARGRAGALFRKQ
jgi:hypothetical protein